MHHSSQRTALVTFGQFELQKQKGSIFCWWKYEMLALCHFQLYFDETYKYPQREKMLDFNLFRSWLNIELEEIWKGILKNFGMSPLQHCKLASEVLVVLQLQKIKTGVDFPVPTFSYIRFGFDVRTHGLSI